MYRHIYGGIKILPFFTRYSVINKVYEMYIQAYAFKDIPNRVIGFLQHYPTHNFGSKNNNASWQLLFLLTLKKNSQLHTKSGEKMNEDLQQLLQKLP